MNRISRKTTLRGVACTLALPCLDIMAKEEKSAPLRSAFIYYPNGTPEKSFGVNQVDSRGRIKSLNPNLKSLEKYKDYLVIPNKCWTPLGNGHGAGTATWLSGGDYDSRKVDVGGVSIDQLIAKEIGDQTMLGSLNLSLKGQGYFSLNVERNNISWRKSNMPCSRDIEPRAVFDRLFRSSQSLPFGKSILDDVSLQARRLKQKGSRSDQAKIDEYLESIRAIERQIDFSKKQIQKRGAKDLGIDFKRPQAGIPENHREYIRLMMDLMVLAFWTDATRVGSFMLDHGQSNRYCDFVAGVKGTWHALSHWRDFGGQTEDDDGITSWNSREEKRGMYAKVVEWHHEQFAYFLDRLKKTPDYEGVLLDHMQICYGSNLSDGDRHYEKDLPIILAGGACGKMKTGRYLKQSRGLSLSRVFLSFLQNINPRVKRFAETDQSFNLA